MAFVVRPSEEMMNDIERIMKKHGCKTKTKVIEIVLRQHVQLDSLVDHQKKEIESLKNELSDVKTILKRKAKADRDYQRLIDSFVENDTD